MNLRERIEAYLQLHKISKADLARHAGLSINTLKEVFRGEGTLAGLDYTPKPETIAALEKALASSPPRKLPRHGHYVEQRWGKASSDQIGKELTPPISGARVRAIAKRMGLTGEGSPA